MNRNYLILLIILPLLSVLYSCNDLESVDLPQFDVVLENDTFFVGEPVTFSFIGSADIITWYSGEPGNDYQFQNIERFLDPSYTMNFESQVIDGAQQDQLSVLVSTNFSGEYNLEEIHKAEWIDITDRFSIPEAKQTRDFVLSGVSDITDLLVEGENITKMFLAIKQVVKDQTVYGNGNLNRVRRISIDTKGLTQSQVYNHNALNWKMISSENKEPDRAKIVSNQLEFRANLVNKTIETEDWAVSTQLEVPNRINLGHDWGTCIKSVNEEPNKNFSYTYSEPGIYHIVFIATNMNAYSKKEVLKEMKLTIISK